MVFAEYEKNKAKPQAFVCGFELICSDLVQ
jgi:hypothetical protein